MRFLLDQNLSPHLAAALDDAFPDIVHVRDLGLASADDATVWERAIRENRIIVSKDADFHQRSFLGAPPPKVLWIRTGNCTTRRIASLLREHAASIRAFADDSNAAFLALG